MKCESFFSDGTNYKMTRNNGGSEANRWPVHYLVVVKQMGVRVNRHIDATKGAYRAEFILFILSPRRIAVFPLIADELPPRLILLVQVLRLLVMVAIC